ncbi:MAG: toxin-antitoxin system YwqK family antitoxin [Fibrobacterota bacterium]
MRYLLILMLVSFSYGWVFRSYSPGMEMTDQTKSERRRTVVRRYYPDSTVRFEAEYHRNRLDGFYREYYPDGTLRSELEFRNGREDGYAHFYYPGGALKTRIYYDNGKIEKFVRFNKEGKKIEVRDEDDLDSLMGD